MLCLHKVGALLSLQWVIILSKYNLVRPELSLGPAVVVLNAFLNKDATLRELASVKGMMGPDMAISVLGVSEFLCSFHWS